jgi:transcriptional/translational regulatory protein YebC/TACO1
MQYLINVSSKEIKHDTRKCVLRYGDNREIVMAHSDFNTLQKLIPEKEYSIVQAKKQQSLVSQSTQSSTSQSIPEQIRELKGLLDDGILTEEEFTAKKYELLAKI